MTEVRKGGERENFGSRPVRGRRECEPALRLKGHHRPGWKAESLQKAGSSEKKREPTILLKGQWRPGERAQNLQKAENWQWSGDTRVCNNTGKPFEARRAEREPTIEIVG